MHVLLETNPSRVPCDGADDAQSMRHAAVPRGGVVISRLHTSILCLDDTFI
jgi:hypothetical protein